ncbi:hypothetical protein WIS52_16830 [Pseudonocardia nematodicida]|uniref:Uncharacterized protein n=1 Tax=Pseudonocardia nematodicida TaxID=1206997 RepID=A0ABV1KDA3_9PSEU
MAENAKTTRAAKKAAKMKDRAKKTAVKALPDQVKAKGAVAAGKSEKAAGTATGDKKLQAKGQAHETGGKGYGKVAKARRKLKK